MPNCSVPRHCSWNHFFVCSQFRHGIAQCLPILCHCLSKGTRKGNQNKDVRSFRCQNCSKSRPLSQPIDLSEHILGHIWGNQDLLSPQLMRNLQSWKQKISPKNIPNSADVSKVPPWWEPYIWNLTENMEFRALIKNWSGTVAGNTSGNLYREPDWDKPIWNPMRTSISSYWGPCQK